MSYNIVLYKGKPILKRKFSFVQWLFCNTRIYCKNCKTIEYHKYNSLVTFTCICGYNNALDNVLTFYKKK